MAEEKRYYPGHKCEKKDCDGVYVVRPRRLTPGRSPFLGCSNFPKTGCNSIKTYYPPNGEEDKAALISRITEMEVRLNQFADDQAIELFHLKQNIDKS